MEDLSDTQKYCYSILGSLSLIFGIIYIWTILSIQAQNIHNSITFFLRNLSWNYSLVLSIELIQKVPEGFRKRVSYYNILSLLLAFSLTLLAYYTDSITQTIYRDSENQNSIGVHSIWIYFIYTPFIISTGAVSVNKKYSVTKRVLVAFWLLNLPYAFNRSWLIFNKPLDWLNDLEAIACSSIGLIVYLIALVSFETHKELTDPLMQNENNKYEETLNDLSNDSQATKQIIASILHILSNSSEFSYKLIDLSNEAVFKSQRRWDITSTNYEFILPVTWTTVEYSSDIFSNICLKDSINKNEIIESMNLMISDENLQGNDINYSHRFIFKFVTAVQLNFFLGSLPKYYKHLLETSRNKSLLNRVIGAYNIKDRNHNFNVLMIENILTSKMSCELFELSGSKLVKNVLDADDIVDSGRKILNDMDFMKNNNYLALSFAETNLLQRVVRDDLEFLKSIGAVEYSLFLAIIKNCNKVELTNRFMRHYFEGKGRKTYAISIVNTFISPNAIRPERLKKIGGIKDYADRFWSLLSTIMQCETFS